MTTRQFCALPMFERGEKLHALSDQELVEFALETFDPCYAEVTNGAAMRLWRDVAWELARRVARKAPVLEAFDAASCR